MNKISRHYNDEYAKRIKEYYKTKEKRTKMFQNSKKVNEKTFFDKLFLRIFLSTFLMLIIVGSKRFFIAIKSDFSIASYFTTNLNIVKFANIFKGTPLTIIPEEDVISVYEENVYDNVEYLDGINYVANDSFSGVTNLVSGYVVKIQKETNGYNITIKGIDGLEYEYQDLESIDFHLYEYLKAGEIIGKAKYQKTYNFKLIIKDSKRVYSFYEKAT